MNHPASSHVSKFPTPCSCDGVDDDVHGIEDETFTSRTGRNFVFSGVAFAAGSGVWSLEGGKKLAALKFYMLAISCLCVEQLLAYIERSDCVGSFYFWIRCRTFSDIT